MRDCAHPWLSWFTTSTDQMHRDQNNKSYAAPAVINKNEQTESPRDGAGPTCSALRRNTSLSHNQQFRAPAALEIHYFHMIRRFAKGNNEILSQVDIKEDKITKSPSYRTGRTCSTLRWLTLSHNQLLWAPVKLAIHYNYLTRCIETEPVRNRPLTCIDYNELTESPRLIYTTINSCAPVLFVIRHFHKIGRCEKGNNVPSSMVI